MTNVLLSFGSLFFSLLLTAVYYLKAKQTGIDNKLYKLLLIVLDLTIISEILTIVLMFYSPNKTILIEIFYRANIILTITWIIIIAFYIILLKTQKANKFIDYKAEIKNSIILKIMLVMYIVSVIVSFVVKIEHFSSEKGVYITGYPLYLMYIIGSASLIFVSFSVAKNRLKIEFDKLLFVIAGIIAGIIAMIFQRIYPMYLMFACMFTFNTYIIYYIFENPDLYLIEELTNAKQRVVDSDKVKTVFLANMSQEIKTPLNVILNYSDRILDRKNFNNQDVKKDIVNIYSAGNNLLETINNILDISKIEKKEKTMEKIEYNIEKLVLDLRNIIDVRLDSEQVEFITYIDPKMPKNLIGDRKKIFQILLNLLSNSVKFTEVGKIRLNISFEKINDRSLNLCFQVYDSGVGIKKENYDKIFNETLIFDPSLRKSNESVGLGLVIARELVLFLGGKIYFKSQYGAGTTFYVNLNQEISDSQETFEDSKVQQNSKKNEYLDCSKYKVLLVDDNKLNLKVAEKVLSNYKFQITCIDNGKECIENIKKGNCYDLILLDHMMPEMDGIEVLKKLKKLEYYKLPPIVVFTANAISGMKEMYLKEGFDDYLSKPINITELDNLLKKYFQNNS